MLCVVASSVAAAHAEDTRPNIIVLLTDDQCCDSLGCYGNGEVKTPHIDQLAADGLLFENHYDTTAICMASRATVMTGLLEYRTGCNFGHGPLVQELWHLSYPLRLREAGYRTAFTGKFGFEVAAAAGDKRGELPSADFDAWGGGPGQTSFETRKNKSMAHYADRYPHSTLSYGAFAQDFIAEAAAREDPFCLSISFKAPHKPPTPDPRFDAIYADRTFTKPANFGREYGRHFAPQSRLGRQYERFESWHYADNYDREMRLYHQQVYGIDVAVGMIREAVKQAGLAETTVIIFTSDNGYLCGAHGYGSKVLPYEESSRVPLILFDPRRATSGQRTAALTGNVDLSPTITALAGLPPLMTEEGSPLLDGRDLMPLYDDPGRSVHESLPLINVWGPDAVHSLAVVTADRKYIVWPYDAEGFTPTEELYDTASDPLELTNLITLGDDQLAAVQADYDDWLAHWREHAVAHNDYRRFAEAFVRPAAGRSR